MDRTAVQPVEKTRAIDGGRRVEILEPVPTGAHIARQGAEGHAGDEVLARGCVLDPASVAVLAAVGKGKVLVGRRPTVSVLVTGDELVDVWDAPTRGRIRNSNGYALMAQARWAGADARSLGVVPDQAPLIAQAVREGFASDVLVISGGVSEGAFDLVEEVLTRFDVGLLFTKVAIKPGAPLVFGRRGGLNTDSFSEELIQEFLAQWDGVGSTGQVWVEFGFTALRTSLISEQSRGGW